MTARLAFDVSGPATAPVVVLGGSLGTRRTVWDAQTSALAEHFRVVRYDHRGHGESDVVPGKIEIMDLAADVLSMLDQIGIQRAAHSGVSLGGMVAMQIAARYPAKVSALALLCTSAHLPPAAGWTDRAATVRAHGMSRIADPVVARWFTAAFSSDPRAQELRDQLVTTPPEGYALCCEAIATMDLRGELGAIHAPTLVIAGADDTATPVDHAEQITEGIRQAELVVIPEAAHLANVGQADSVSALLLGHLASWTGEHHR